MKYYVAVLTAVVFLFFSLACEASSDNLFWFVLISDTHIGVNESYGKKLSEMVGNTRSIINPRFIANAGDLTDQHAKAVLIRDVQDQQQWIEYNQIVKDVPNYYDMPGNHDIYYEDLTNYLNYSSQRLAQNSWALSSSYYNFCLITTDTTNLKMINPVNDLSKSCPGELSDSELVEIKAFLDVIYNNYNKSDPIFIFGHHAIDNPETEKIEWGSIASGGDEFIQILNDCNVSFYGYGHTHESGSYYLNSKTLVYNVDSLGENGKYAIIAVDDNGISATEAETEKWPVVLITAPLDKELGGGNPFARKIISGEKIPVRALIFSDEYLFVDDVAIRYRKKLSLWQDLPVNRTNCLNKSNSYLWESEWDTCGCESGEYKIEVEVENAGINKKDEITVEIQEPDYGVDVVLVIDTSGSMDDYYYGDSDLKISAAKDAAKKFVNLTQINDKIGVVGFESYAYISYYLTQVSADNQDEIKNEIGDKIDRLSPWGGTNIGNGLWQGQNQLETYGRCDPVWSMILLSDGQDSSQATKDVITEVKKTKTRVYTIGLGGDVDESLMNQIASETNGFYRFAPSGEQLAIIYQDIQNTMSGMQGVISEIHNIMQGETKKLEIIINSSIKAIFQAAIKGSDIGLSLIDPNGNVIDPNTNDPNVIYAGMEAFKSYTILSPQAGQWQMIVTGTDVEDGGEPISIVVSATSEIEMEMDFDRIDYASNNPITVIAKLADSSGAILAADISADIQTPSGVGNLILFDDGAHSDDASGDGVYAGSFVDTAEKGNYTFQVKAAGISNGGYAFTRTATKTTVVGLDTDGDGMTDAWENFYGLDININDASDDADADGLINIREYQLRTNPKDDDSDGDGYDDQEEVNLDSDPLNADDLPVYIHANCQNVSIQLQDGQVSIVAEQIDNGSTAFYGIVSLAVFPCDFTSDNLGENEVILTVVDTQGHAGECLAIVTVSNPPVVIDTTPPTALCRDVAVELGKDNTISITPDCVNNGSSDSVGIVSLNVSPNSFDCDDVGDNNVVLTVKDAAGNQSECSAVVAVEDGETPTAICREEIAIQLNEFGSAYLSADQVDNGSHDNCGEVLLSLSKTDFNVEDVGRQRIYLAVTDKNNNQNQCSADVIVSDYVAPVIVEPEPEEIDATDDVIDDVMDDMIIEPVDDLTNDIIDDATSDVSDVAEKIEEEKKKDDCFTKALGQ